MSEPDTPQIYLITPPAFELTAFCRELATVLDTVPVACLRLALASHDEDTIMRTADAVRLETEKRDIAMVIDTHVALAERLGLDGVHLPSPTVKSVREARKRLGGDAIVGAWAGTSRHDGMNLGEAGADYICFGPVGVTSLGDGAQADPDLFAWWSQMIELPVVAEGALDEDGISTLSGKTDFFALGSEIWGSEIPQEEAAKLATLIGLA